MERGGEKLPKKQVDKKKDDKKTKPQRKIIIQNGTKNRNKKLGTRK